ncbi:MAG: type II toxin-antitoxin system YhaV family toxin [Microbacteriaceae bacterium]|nr:type II toxin-antitoxin system YhaV family toxin [Microbacteriaceae bacterium]
MSSKDWFLLGHHEFLTQLEKYREANREVKQKIGADSIHTKQAQRLKALTLAVWTKIPTNPSNPELRLGNALGKEHTHWFRDKFLQQYRVFFRYSTRSKIIAYGWVNDDETLRAYGSKTDAYLVFKKMLESGKVPNNWDELVAETKKIS